MISTLRRLITIEAVSHLFRADGACVWLAFFSARKTIEFSMMTPHLCRPIVANRNLRHEELTK